MQGPEPTQVQMTEAQLTDVTVRQIVHLTLGGPVLRVQLSNAFGTQPLRVDAVHVAKAKAPGQSAIDAATDHAVMFGGKEAVLIPAGAVYLSDPVALPMEAAGDLAISLHYAEPPSVTTTHVASHATTFLVHGVHTADAELVEPEKVLHWVGLAEVDVTAPAEAGAVVAFGDSITDGTASTTDANNRWPNVLAARLLADKKLRGLAVVNEGIGGNHLLTDRVGEAALKRFDRDVLAISGVRYLVVLEGINDLGALSRRGEATADERAELVGRMEGALQQVIDRAHANGIAVIGCTITADGGAKSYHPTAEDDAARAAVNAWILTPGHFDGTVDLDKVTRDPADATKLQAGFDSGDHLHPGPAGYKAMGEAIPLELFR
jgi:lysophospholipase L1-like esterase